MLLFLALSGVFKKRDLIFFELALEDLIPDQKPDIGMSLVRVTKEDIETTDNYFDGWFKKGEALKRLQQGCVLFAVKDKEKRIFYQWLEFQTVDIPFLDLSFSLPDDTACMAYIYTVPEYRGKGFASKAKPLILHYLRKWGYRKIVLTIEPYNTASQRVNKKAGFKAYQTVSYVRLFFLKYYCVKDYETGRKKAFWHIRGAHQELWKTFSKLGHA